MEQHIEIVENSDLPRDTVEAACEALAFVQGFHDTLSEWGVVSGKEVDTAVLEKAFDSFIAELSAASIFCASFKNVVENLNNTAKACEKNGSPPLIVEGYKKFASRVQKTHDNLFKEDIEI